MTPPPEAINFRKEEGPLPYDLVEVVIGRQFAQGCRDFGIFWVTKDDTSDRQLRHVSVTVVVVVRW